MELFSLSAVFLSEVRAAAASLANAAIARERTSSGLPRDIGEKNFSAIINMTYRCRVGFDMIHTEREREGALPWNEDRQADRDIVRAAAGRENHGTGAGRTV